VAIAEAYVEGLNEVLRAFKALPKEASDELRKSSMVIAERHMAPAWRNAALYYAGPWGPDIADSVRVKRDRVPAVNIGDNKKTFRGGATASMVRFPSDTGERRQSFAPFEQTNWISKVRAYQPDALREWGEAVDRIVSKWDRM
jgi:hypothetical protein